MLRINRRKRAVDDEDDETMNDAGDYGPQVRDEQITTPDVNDTVPRGPLHQHTSWPSGLTEENATDICDAAVRAAPLFDECLEYAVEDRIAYVNGCVADIRVTLSRH